MKIYLVFEHDWEGLIFRAAYEHFDSALEHAQLINQQSIAAVEIHGTSLQEKFLETSLKMNGSTPLWTSFDQGDI